MIVIHTYKQSFQIDNIILICNDMIKMNQQILSYHHLYAHPSGGAVKYRKNGQACEQALVWFAISSIFKWWCLITPVFCVVLFLLVKSGRKEKKKVKVKGLATQVVRCTWGAHNGHQDQSHRSLHADRHETLMHAPHGCGEQAGCPLA